MRRTLPVVIGCLLLAAPLFAQRGGGHGGGGGGGMRGGGSGGARGGFSGGGPRGGGGFRGGESRSGGFRGGFRGIGGYRGFRSYGSIYYPGFYGYGYYDPYLWDSGFDYGDPGYGYAANGYNDYGGYGSYGAPNPSPQVLVISNQTPPAPVIIQPPPAPAAWDAGPTAQAKRYEDTLFLLAMKDGTIRAVLAYWVEGITVHYVTMDHEQKQTPLSSLDHSLSERLNRERNVTFRLPG